MNLLLNNGFYVVLSGIFTLLAGATALVYRIANANRQRDYRELKQRVSSWWWIAGALALALLLGRTASLFLFAFISFLAFKEYLSLIPTRRADRRVLFWAYMAIPVQYFWIGIEWYGMFVLFVPVYMFLLLPVGMMLSGETKGFLRAAGTLQWGLMGTVFALSHIAYLLVLPDSRYANVNGPGLVLFLLVLTELNDVAQYCWGKMLGRHKVTPNISPNKTWEGLIGGVFTTVLVAQLLAPLLTPFGLLGALAAGALIGITGFFGDLSVSCVKRDIGVKDSGGLLPGHGGILDRIDSLTYTAPLFFHFLRYNYF